MCSCLFVIHDVLEEQRKEDREENMWIMFEKYMEYIWLCSIQFPEHDPHIFLCTIFQIYMQ